MQLDNLSLALHCNGFVYLRNLFAWFRYHNYDLIIIPYVSIITAIFPREPRQHFHQIKSAGCHLWLHVPVTLKLCLACAPACRVDQSFCEASRIGA